MNYRFVSEINDIRIDSFLSDQLERTSRAYVSELIKTGKVLCNGKPCKPSLRISIGDTVEIELPEPILSSVQGEDIPLDIAYEDEWLAVINKPRGQVVHPAPGHKSGTLVNALIYHYRDNLSDLNGTLRPGIVHRIDKDTSGLLIIVKKNEIHAAIAKAISNHSIKRTYLAIVCGIISEDNGTINLPIGRNPQNRLKNAVVKDGKNAVSHFKVLKRFSQFTYVEVSLETGRTHQIRVHMSHINHPILGDSLYGGKRKNIKLDGQALHAFRLEFKHPITNRDIIVESIIPDYFKELLTQLA